MDRKKWTIDEIRAHGATIGFETAAEVLGIGKSPHHELARAGQFPVRRIQLGRRVIISVPDYSSSPAQISGLPGVEASWPRSL